MNPSSPSALITDQGLRVLLRLKGRFCELTQEDLLVLLELPRGPLVWGLPSTGSVCALNLQETSDK